MVNTGMELRKINHCIALAQPSVWVWAKGSWFKWLHVSGWAGLTCVPLPPTHLQSCSTASAVLHCSQELLPYMAVLPCVMWLWVVWC